MDVDQMKPEDFEAAEEDMEGVAKPGVDISLTDDGGVVKRISTMGSGWDSPEKGDEVTVHYTGTLSDGTKFDSSVDRGDPFSFTLGEGSVIKSWDIGVATMKKGEKALLIAQPEYAYGAQGSPPKIPPNSTLHFEVELISWKSIKDISGDGGVIKTIKHEASGWEKPSERDVAQYTYSISVKGKAEVVAQSPEGGASHEVANAPPLKAFSHALPTMKKGEIVHLCVTSQYGFEAGQLPQGVSDSDQMEATLELTGWQKVEDVTEDGAIVKKTVVSSEDWKKPNVGATVTVHLTGRLADGGVFEDQELTFVTDEEQVPEGVELAVHKMKLGETAEVSVAAKYAFGDVGCESRAGGSVSVPADADVTWTIRLIDLKNAKASYDMSDEEKVAAALTAKEKGNARFKAGKWVAALVKYKAAVDLTKSDKDFSASQRTSARDTCRAAQLNSAACHMKLGNARECLNAANEVLSRESGNVKALYRAGQAHLALRDYVEAEAAIKKGLSEEPTNSALRALLKEYKQQAAESNKKDRTMFSKMFRPSKRSTADTATSASTDVSQSAASAPHVEEQAAQAAESPASHPIMTAPSEEMVDQSGGANEARGGTDEATAMETS